MGLFSFLKKAGAALTGGSKKTITADSPEPADTGISNEQKAVLLKGIVASHGLDIKNMSLEVNDDKVTVYGEVPSQDEREKVVLALGNVSGISSVDDRTSIVAPPPPPSAFHTVVSGDTLGKIAKKYYGDAMKYPVIFEANKPMLSDPNKIYPGQSLRIPNANA